MDEYNRGIDPEVKRYFKQIISSFSVGLLWLIVVMTMGIFMGMGIVQTEIRWYNIFFYIFFFSTLIWLLFFFYRVWRTREEK